MYVTPKHDTLKTRIDKLQSQLQLSGNWGEFQSLIKCLVKWQLSRWSFMWWREIIDAQFRNGLKKEKL